MRTIFISYRREDAEGQAGRLFDDLAAHFGKASVFMDVVGIEPGRDFRRVIDQHVSTCGVLLAMVGKRWLDAADEQGKRRLDDPMDFVRLETVSALKRDIPVVPVLVHGAHMPKAEQLPGELAELAYRNGVELTHARWDSDVQVLIKALSPYVDTAPPAASNTAPPATAPTSNKTVKAMIAASLAALVIGGVGYTWHKVSSERAEIARQAALMEEAKNKAAAEELEAKKQAEVKAAELEKKQAQERAAAETLAARKQAMEAESNRAAQEIADSRKRDNAVVANATAAAKIPASNGSGTTPALTRTGLKIDKVQCVDLGNAKYQLHLWGWASGETGSLVFAGPNLPPGTGVVDEARISCPGGWGAAQPNDGPVFSRACKRGQNNAGRTLWYTRTTFQWRPADSPSNAFAALQRPSTTTSERLTDRITFSCGKS